jgi:hypothetical protein
MRGVARLSLSLSPSLRPSGLPLSLEEEEEEEEADCSESRRFARSRGTAPRQRVVACGLGVGVTAGLRERRGDTSAARRGDVERIVLAFASPNETRGRENEHSARERAINRPLGVRRCVRAH